MLKTDSPRAANLLKIPVVGRFKVAIHQARYGTKDDALINEAFSWREVLRADTGDEGPDGTTPLEALDDRVQTLRQLESSQRLDLFTAVATGVATPINTLVEKWIEDRGVAPRTATAYRHGIKQLERWCEATSNAPTLEHLTARLAEQFVSDVLRAKDPATANKVLTGLSSYWTWLLKKEHLAPDAQKNVWAGTRVPKRRPLRGEAVHTKRPFTDAEVIKLMAGITAPGLKDLCWIAALSGMRLTSIAELRVKQVGGGLFDVWDDKTEGSRRIVPIHSELLTLVDRRTKGKGPEDFLFPELPVQQNAARGRGAPASQAFTRERRRLGVDDQPKGARQSRIDFHSWRRWFIRKALEALEDGAKGFTAFTIADVVGHSNEEGPLPMTIGRYPGKASVKALAACVQSVTLPQAP